MTIVFIKFPYRVEVKGHHKEIYEWCNKFFETGKWTMIGPDVYGFTNETDKFIFILRWT